MAGDNLREIIDAARLSLPDAPADFWERFEATVRRNFGATRVYIAAHRKRQHLDALAVASPDETGAHLAQRLGVTERRVRQYKQLMRLP